MGKIVAAARQSAANFRRVSDDGFLPKSRYAITYEAEAEEKTSETVVQKIFDELPVP